MDYFKIDIPFNNRHQCWFCGEPSEISLDYPRRVDFEAKGHLSINLPICDECNSLATKESSNSIYDLKLKLTHKNLIKYARVLGIGINWTKLELESEQLSGAAFVGFNESAWGMYEIARQRIAFQGWPLTYDEIPLELIDDSHFFESEGVKFLNVSSAIDYYCDAEGLDKELLSLLSDLLGETRFKDTLLIARVNTNLTRKERQQILNEVEKQESDSRKVEKRNSHFNIESVDIDVGEISPVLINSSTLKPDDIHWLFINSVDSFDKLSELEDLFFEDFYHLGGVGALQLYNTLQLYLGVIEDKTSNFEDPNSHLWSGNTSIKTEVIGRKFKAVADLKTGNKQMMATLIFDELTDKQIVRKLLLLLDTVELNLKFVSKDSDEDTEVLYLKGKFNSSMNIVITDMC
ncbi:hypothetical protein A9264_13995 [Vibrio sp. UCD-FRSSP16_10]|uniref:hypothetical protein n=1 Tax=unclassified Vibrio TaxID=2614977 RepID=UPI0007FC2785|nr:MULTISPECIES: hypothetical protein [unclassified Vibrio]OBT13524.1 hypothetical protein A9260_14375 [Vibrio sp. UCD-FRSSP16_30]OBT19983.1 hypothetical protein A9264_13995 [Vibrio sp. UCD-FRSSP16_10]